ncbi:hypothetical protein pb186bvf_000151 [Paramecium bursaria]
MFKYLNESQVPDQFLCVICIQICLIPLQCYHCLALHCYSCIIKNKNQCGRGCRQKIKKVIMKPKTTRSLEQISCKCDICHEFISYKSYRKHTNLCTQQNTKSLNQNQGQIANNQIINQDGKKREQYFHAYTCLNNNVLNRKQRKRLFKSNSLQNLKSFLHQNLREEKQAQNCSNVKALQMNYKIYDSISIAILFLIDQT